MPTNPSQSSAVPRSAARILVVDDEPDLLTLYELTLLREGYSVDTAGCLADARAYMAQHRYELLITDMRLPDGMGSELLNELTAQQREERCVVITAYGSAENAVEALKAGAFDYLTKPVDLRQFRTVVAAAVVPRPAARTAPSTSPSAPTQGFVQPNDGTGTHPLERLIGQSAAMLQVKARIAKVATSMAPVLIRGESGTGKELAAAAIHACSHRAQGPFVAVNCGAIPETLLESEFFGARKGAFTGATQDRQGFFQAASGGTLFLDEIGDLPLSMQSKLLRAIQERQVRAIGATQEEPVDVRILSATHVDLALAVTEGRFRQDLFYRLNVIQIDLPPLRERRDDIPLLCSTLLQKISAGSGAPVPPLSAAAARQLADLEFPGNVRELENLLHRAVALSDGAELHLSLSSTAVPDSAPSESAAAPSPLSLMPQQAETVGVASADGVATPTADPVLDAIEPIPTDLQAFLDQKERAILVRVLTECGFNRTAAAARLNLSLRQIRYRMEKLHIEVPGELQDTPDEA